MKAIPKVAGTKRFRVRGAGAVLKVEVVVLDSLSLTVPMTT